MSLIEFQDYPSTETPLNAENLNHNFNELNKIGSCASFSKKDNQNLGEYTRETIIFNTTDYVDNECFELQSDGKIKVLKDISRVLVNYNIRFNDAKNTDVIVYCKSTEDEGFNTSFVTNSVTIPGSGILKVKKNSLIQLDAYSNRAIVQGYSKEWCGINLCVLK